MAIGHGSPQTAQRPSMTCFRWDLNDVICGFSDIMTETQRAHDAIAKRETPARPRLTARPGAAAQKSFTAGAGKEANTYYGSTTFGLPGLPPPTIVALAAGSTVLVHYYSLTVRFFLICGT